MEADCRNDFEEYFKAGEPGRRERAEAWATAIGLQQVDGLVPSQFLFKTASVLHAKNNLVDPV